LEVFFSSTAWDPLVVPTFCDAKVSVVGVAETVPA
jgi:hypothetical protein